MTSTFKNILLILTSICRCDNLPITLSVDSYQVPTYTCQINSDIKKSVKKCFQCFLGVSLILTACPPQTPSALKVHEKTHSSAINLHQCRACEAAFRNPGQLYVHFKLKHLKLKRSDKVSIKNISNPERQLIVNGKPQ